jgi:hypothetical protein
MKDGNIRFVTQYVPTGKNIIPPSDDRVKYAIDNLIKIARGGLSKSRPKTQPLNLPKE